MTLRQERRWSLGLQALPIAMAALQLGCPQPIQVSQEDRLPDAAVAPMPPRALCTHEVREVGTIAAGAEGQLAARLVRGQRGAVLVKALASTSEIPAILEVGTIGRDGAFTSVSEMAATGEVGPVLSIDARIGGGVLFVALTRPGGRVDLLTISEIGETKAPPRALSVEPAAPAKVLYFQQMPVVFAGGRLFDATGEPLRIRQIETSRDVQGASSDADLVGESAETGLRDGGTDVAPVDATLADATDGEIRLSAGLFQAVVAGDSIGWLRADERGIALEHFLPERNTIVTTFAAPAGHMGAQLLWAGDRYLVGDPAGAEIARYVLTPPRRPSGDRGLRLGGRMSIPRPPEVPAWMVWDNAGSRHVGIAQLLGPRHLRFVNLALSGLVLDAAVHIRREREIIGAQVLWDGAGYVLIWGEREGDRGALLFVARFACPDER